MLPLVSASAPRPSDDGSQRVTCADTAWGHACSVSTPMSSTGCGPSSPPSPALSASGVHVSGSADTPTPSPGSPTRQLEDWLVEPWSDLEGRPVDGPDALQVPGLRVQTSDHPATTHRGPDAICRMLSKSWRCLAHARSSTRATHSRAGRSRLCGRSMLLGYVTLFRVARGVPPHTVHRFLSSRLTRWVSRPFCQALNAR